MSNKFGVEYWCARLAEATSAIQRAVEKGEPHPFHLRSKARAAVGQSTARLQARIAEKTAGKTH